MKDRFCPVPQSRLSRLAAFGKLAGGVPAGVVGEGLERLERGERPHLHDLLLTPSNARRVTEQLSRLRGAAMKLGQMLSLDAGDLLPAELTIILAQLRDTAHVMPPGQLQQTLNSAWGPDWRRRPHGAITFAEREEIHTGIFPVVAVKPTGAGDSFLAGCLASLGERRPMRGAILRTSACASIMVAKPGCAPAMPLVAELEAFLAAHPGVTSACKDINMHVAPYDNANKPLVDIGNALVPLNYFNIVKLKRGDAFEYQVPGYETCIVPATRTVDVTVEGVRFADLEGRSVDLCDGEPQVVYVPIGARVTIVYTSEATETFIAGARYTRFWNLSRSAALTSTWSSMVATRPRPTARSSISWARNITTRLDDCL
jgi:hypothetical protein